MNQRSNYSTTAIWFHWIIAILIITNIGLAEFTEDMSREARGPYMDYHKAIGITILFLSIGRLGWRLGHKPPPLPANMPGWQTLLSKISHVLFYVLMIGLPIGGWLWMSTYPAPFSYFGLFEVPMLPVEGNKALGEALHEGHKLGGKIMLGLVVLHLLAVAKHHLVDKHNLLARMWPG
ncbi:cytochrome b [Parasphingorhabdus halotolerans]|uniref:Cytochrome b n=1 Tax=Parasphingorhabdus halotolerans TaxID=2725558 RepID=A0A6H2DL65_9SPHN|nr:cytochrome b [Parasphingorhabdus halotolerans]QJB69412.1 cytochrome b [Parasphingorhabdus halotolerans]